MSVATPTWDSITDEHGEITDPSVPAFLVSDPESLRRWLMCRQVAQNFTGKPAEDPESILFATTLFASDIPTGPPDYDPQLAEAAARPTGVMVALYPTPEVATALALKGGEPPKEIHLTLAYLGKVPESHLDEDALAHAVAAWARECEPLTGELSGFGIFTAGPKPVTYASVDLPTLPAERERLVRWLERAGAPPSADHGFTPHMTLAYARRQPTIKPMPITFDRVTLAYAGRHHSFPLGSLAEGRIPGTGDLRPSLPFDAAEHRRNRIGRFMEMPDRAMPGKLRSPGTDPAPGVTEADIRKAGLDKPPTKGEAAQRILGDAKDTFELFGPEEPSADPRFPEYAADRKAAQDALIADMLEGKTPPAGAPHALFMAGGPASGKTSVLRVNRDVLAPPEENTVHVDVDDIKELMGQYGMPEYDDMRAADDRYAATAVHRESGDIAARMINEAMARKLNVIIDGTGDSDPGLFSQQLKDMDDAKYSVDVLYVDKPTADCVVGSIKRAEAKGRFVPIPVVRDQHKKVSINFRDEISRLDFLNSLRVYDADGTATAEMLADGTMSPVNPQRYAAFMAKADEKSDEAALKKLEKDDPLAEAAGGTIPPEKWIPEMPNDSSEYLGRRNGPWPNPYKAEG